MKHNVSESFKTQNQTIKIINVLELCYGWSNVVTLGQLDGHRIVNTVWKMHMKIFMNLHLLSVTIYKCLWNGLMKLKSWNIKWNSSNDNQWRRDTGLDNWKINLNSKGDNSWLTAFCCPGSCGLTPFTNPLSLTTLFSVAIHWKV